MYNITERTQISCNITEITQIDYNITDEIILHMVLDKYVCYFSVLLIKLDCPKFL